MAQSKIWLGVAPLPPRENEGNTYVDLAVGAIVRRGATGSGVNLAPGASSWVCFAEAKWASPFSTGVTYDPTRHQLTRDIENVLCFQDSGQYAQRVYFAVIASRGYFHPSPFDLYQRDRNQLVRDLAGCRLRKYERNHWHYPRDIEDRARALGMRWLTYEDLFEKLPESLIRQALREFWRQCVW